MNDKILENSGIGFLPMTQSPTGVVLERLTRIIDANASHPLVQTFECSGVRQTLCYILCAIILLLSVAISCRVPTRTTNEWRSSKTNELSKELIEMIASRNWSSFLVWITFHPDELKWVDKKSQTVLHYACLFRTPVQIMGMLLFQAPELTSTPNRDGELALHWAVRLSAPNEVLKLLLTANPSSGVLANDKDRQTPLSILWDRHQENFLREWRQGRESLLFCLPGTGLCSSCNFMIPSR